MRWRRIANLNIAKLAAGIAYARCRVAVIFMDLIETGRI